MKKMTHYRQLGFFLDALYNFRRRCRLGNETLWARQGSMAEDFLAQIDRPYVGLD